MANWNPPETAPKDRAILIDAGWPWAVLAVWSDTESRWVTAQIESSLFEGKHDPYWITDHEHSLIGWMDLPEVPRRGQ